MTKHRLIQCIALFVSVVALVSAALLSTNLQQRRVDAQLVSHVELSSGTPPAVAMAATALGSFRGVAANVLWYRLEMLKREGQFYEADTLSRLITTLQPRFPQVWVFTGWNMAYNISVETHTPQERWDWVNKGIRLLREEAIPMNPNSIRLYRELGWFHFHKVGERTDDMHKYYKYKFADEWDRVLGPMYEGRSDDEITAVFSAIVRMHDRYWGLAKLDYLNRSLLRRLLDLPLEDAELIRQVYLTEETALDQVLPEIDRLEEILRGNAVELSQSDAADTFSIDQYVEALRRGIQRQLDLVTERTAGDTAFFDDFSGDSGAAVAAQDPSFFQAFELDQVLPDVRPVVERLSSGGIDLDRSGLQRLGKIIGTVNRLLPTLELQYRYWKMTPEEKRPALERLGLDQADIAIYDLLAGIRFNHLVVEDGEVRVGTDTDLATPFRQALLPYWRAKVLSQAYRMDPTTMLLLMSQYGPIDWRSPSAHSIYWGQAGLQRTMQLVDQSRVDVVNTQRGVIHGLQSLERYGRVLLNPYASNPNDRVTYQPNFVFAKAYEKAVFSSKEIYASLTGAREGALDSFDQGHENFLIDVANRAFVYGEEALAEEFYLRARTLYGTSPEGEVAARYAKPLPDFVYDELNSDLLSRYDVARNAMTLLVQRAFKEGVAFGDLENYDRLMAQAKDWYDQFQDNQSSTYKATTQTSRLSLEPWPEFVGNAFVNYMTNPTEPPVNRNVVIRNAEPALIRSVAERLIEPLSLEFGGDWQWLATGSQRAVGSDELDAGNQQRN